MSINDVRNNALTNLGFSGNNNDKENAWWTSWATMGLTFDQISSILKGGGQNAVLLTANDQTAAADNVTLIQEALDTGGEIEIYPSVVNGDIYINDTLQVKSNSVVRTRNGGTIKAVDELHKLIICNEALYQTPATVTVTWSAGRAFTVNWTAHNLERGDSIALQGASPAWWNITYRIISVTDANSFVCVADELPTAAPTGTISGYKCDKNITIDVKFDYNQRSGGTNTVAYDTMGSMWAFIADSYIKINGFDTQKYIASLTAALNVEFDCYGECESDIFKLYGASRDVHFTVSGNSHDDCFSLQCLEPAAFIDYQPAFGPIRNVKALNSSVSQNDGSHSGAIVLYMDDTYNMHNILIDGGYTDTRTTTGFRVNTGDGFTVGSNYIEDLTIKDVQLGGANGRIPLSISSNCHIKNLVIDGVHPVANDAAANSIIRSEPNVVHEVVTIKNIVELTDYDTSRFFIELLGACDSLIIESVQAENTSKKLKFCSVRGDIKTVHINGGSFSGISHIVEIPTVNTSSPVVKMTAVKGDTLNNAFKSLQPCTLIMDGCDFSNCSDGIVKNSDSSANRVTVYDTGSKFDGSTLLNSNGGEIVPMSTKLVTDLTATGITPAVGATATTSAIAGTIAAGKPVISDGTSWFDMTDTSKFYTP